MSIEESSLAPEYRSTPGHVSFARACICREVQAILRLLDKGLIHKEEAKFHLQKLPPFGSLPGES